MSLDELIEQLTGSKELFGEMLEQRKIGLDWPENALTMIGHARLRNFGECIEAVVKEEIEGDIIECGVWRGGACIYARKLLNTLGSQKKVFVADSFEGLPQPDMKFPGNENCKFWNDPYLAVSLENVRWNFTQYELLDGVEFVKGWFKDSLPSLSGPFSVVRIDGDLYESTMDALTALYPKLSNGGYVILDEYMKLPSCRNAVEVFRWKQKVTNPINVIDHSGAYWRKT